MRVTLESLCAKKNRLGKKVAIQKKLYVCFCLFVCVCDFDYTLLYSPISPFQKKREKSFQNEKYFERHEEWESLPPSNTVAFLSFFHVVCAQRDEKTNRFVFDFNKI